METPTVFRKTFPIVSAKSDVVVGVAVDFDKRQIFFATSLGYILHHRHHVVTVYNKSFPNN